LRELVTTGAVIAEGRDMGSRVFPEAEVKIFLEAAPEVRAHRRWLELQTQGRLLPEQDVCQDMAERDKRDRERREDPLRVPDGAHCLDSTAYDLDQVEEICIRLIQPFL
jgi:cytidylate kinase